ncbi:zinc finger protein 58-like [Chrysoperla carnea]|uniref:zinc finger protein 58-like n=1 Tax=Chrysoperla carnea TaxID=189513 RepID=UPI001D071291|nr:zinc finger protein 58-like [Chrysoperla carnea]
MSVEHFCRLCATKFPLSSLKDLEELRNEQLDALILQYLQIKIAERDGYPNTACKLCCKTLSNFHEFLIKVKIAQHKLRGTIAHGDYNSDIKIEKEFNDSGQPKIETKLDETDKNTSLFLPDYHTTKSDNVKTEVDYGNDYDDTIDNFLNDFTNEAYDSEPILDKTDTKSEQDDQNINDTNKDNITTNDQLNTTVNDDKESIIIKWKCYKCEARVRTAKCLQKHFDKHHKCKAEYVCVECNALFDNVPEFETHYYGHEKLKQNTYYRKKYSCDVCGKQFSHASNYKAHRNSHLDTKQFACEHCGRKFKLKQQKEVHRLTVCLKAANTKPVSNSDDSNDDDTDLKSLSNLDEQNQSELNDTNNIELKTKWKCKKCKQYFHSAYILQKHCKAIHGIKNIGQVCTVCDEMFDDNDTYEDHFKTVHGISSKKTGPFYKCEECSKQFNHKSNYLVHTLIHSGIKPFACKDCGKKFHLKQNLVGHSLTHLESRKELKCTHCDKVCKTQYILDRHLKTHIPEYERYKYKCEVCSRKFVALENLEIHFEISHKNIDYICDQCGKVFKTKSLLSAHSNIHKNLSFKCPLCPKVFKSTTALNSHKLTHVEKAYACEECGKKFSQRRQLTVHSTVHTKILPHECSYCKKRFRRKYCLTVHVRQHTGERPYSCTECNHHFANDSNFIKHLKGRHGLQNVSIANKHRYPFDD